MPTAEAPAVANTPRLPSRGRSLAAMAVILSFLLLPLGIALFDPHVDQLGQAQSLCPFMALTGLPCPGCGMIKAMVALYRGHIVESLRYHLLAIPLVAFFVAGLFMYGAEAVTRRNHHPHWLYNMRLAVVAACVVCVYHAARLVVLLATHSFEQLWQQSIWAV